MCDPVPSGRSSKEMVLLQEFPKLLELKCMHVVSRYLLSRLCGNVLEKEG